MVEPLGCIHWRFWGSALFQQFKEQFMVGSIERFFGIHKEDVQVCIMGLSLEHTVSINASRHPH